MRTVAAGTITQALIDTQSTSGRVPYIKIFINSIDYSSRLSYIEHHEETYRERAIIGLSNRDNLLDGLDIDGEEFEIGYGYDSSAEPGGSTTDKVDTATLWVKSHQIISIQGERIFQIYAEGMWMRLREQKIIAGVTGAQDGSDLDGKPYGRIFNRTHTVWELMELIIDGAMEWNLIIAPSDGIINTFRPVFQINGVPFENAAALLYKLIWMTKEYLRPKAGKNFQCIYPQTSDAVDETYHSNKAHYFTEFVEKTILLIPNSIVVLCNQDPVTGEWDKLIVGAAKDDVQIAKYTEIVEPFLAGSITNQDDANRRAAAILTRLKSEILANRLVVPHDSQVELYDKVEIQDARGL